MTKPIGVRTEHPDYTRMAPLWLQCSDAAEGEYVIHAAGEQYLPKLKGEEKDAYAARKARTPFFNATWRTISGLKGMLFRKAPVAEATPAVIELLKDADMAGTTFEGLSQETAEELLTTGRHCLLVDFPPTNTEGLTQAAVAAMKLRPMILQYKAADLINWKAARVNNAVQLTLAVLRESADAATDEFSQDTKTQYRVLDLVSLDGAPTYRQRVFQVIDDKDVQVGGDIFPMMGNKQLDFIPLVILGVDRIGPRVESPPLLDLVAMNLHHYQVSADYEHGCHFTGLPTPVISGYTSGEGENAKPIYIGGDAVICLPNPDAKATYLEVTTDFEALRKNLEDKKAQMAVLGARMLEAQKTGVEAAETLKRRTAGEQSQLAALAETMTLGLTKVLQIFSDWAGGSGEVKVQINKEFMPAGLTAQELTALVGAWQSGGMSDQTLFWNLQRGEVQPPGTTFEEEQERIRSKPPVLPSAA